MLEAILDIENGIDRIEAFIKTLSEERDKARAEASELKHALDGRELELLQMEEEFEGKRRGYEDKLSESGKAREELELRLSEVASKVRNLMPILDDYQPRPPQA